MNISIKSISIQGWNRIQNAHEIIGQKTNHEKNDAAGHIAATLKLSKEGMEKTRNLHEKVEMLEHDYDRMNQGVNKNGYSDIINSIRERLAQINQSTDMRGNKRIEEEYQKALAEIQELLQDQKKVYEEKSEQAKELAEDFSTDQTKILEKESELLIMLESFQKKEDEKQDTQTSANPEEDKSVSPFQQKEEQTDDTHTVSDAIMSLSRETSREVNKKDRHMTDTIQQIYDSAQKDIHQANMIGKDITEALHSISDTLDDEMLSQDEKIEKISQAWKNVSGSLDEMAEYRANGLMQMSNYHDLKRMNLGNHIMVDANKAIDEMQDLSNDVLIKEELEKLVERLEEENEEMIQDKEETVEIEENSDTIRIDEEEQEEIKS